MHKDAIQSGMESGSVLYLPFMGSRLALYPNLSDFQLMFFRKLSDGMLNGLMSRHISANRFRVVED